QAQAVDGAVGADDRDLPERLAQQPAGGVDVIVVDLQTEEIPDLGDPGPGGHAEAAVAQVLDLGLGRVVLVGDLPDDLLEYVLDGVDAGHSAVLVDHHRDVDVAGLHLAQHVPGRHRLGDEPDRPHDLTHSPVGPRIPGRVDRPHHVLDVEHPAQVVHAVPDHGDARESGADEQAHRLVGGGVGSDGDHVGARHHQLAHHGIAELEDALDHAAGRGVQVLVLQRPVHGTAGLSSGSGGIIGV